MKTAEQIAEKLWKKNHVKVGVDSWEVMDKGDFLAALKEYGLEVRQRAAEKANEASPDGFDIGAGDGAATVFQKTRRACAAAIELEELP